MTLHCVFSKALGGASLHQLQRTAGPGDAILLTGPSVRVAQRDHKELPAWLATGAKLVVLEEDLCLMAVDDVDERIAVTDQQGFLDLAIEHPKQMAWR